ncbi:MAG: Prephenate dehydrogenase [Firmicutes bacterium]|nr:Prephenate dehydrogenase [Bacillota bacterium]
MAGADFSDFGINIAIVGLGLIGGSYAMALRELNPKSIIGIDKDPGVIGEALSSGVIDSGSTSGSEALKDANLVIMALYPKESVEFLKKNVRFLKKGAVVTDSCGVKKDVIEKVCDFLPEHVDFIGGHPMAGKEKKGLRASDKNLFKGTNYILTPIARNRKENVKLVENMAVAIGCKNVVSITPEEHDRVISLTSQLPHVIALALVNSCLSETNIGLFAGGSFSDATRVAEINSTLWSQLLLMNSENLLEVIEKFEDSISRIKSALRDRDKEALDDIFISASTNKRKMV